VGGLTKGQTITVADETGAIKKKPRWGTITPCGAVRYPTYGHNPDFTG